MRSRGVNTILLITHDRLVRADLGPGRVPAVAAVHEERRPAADDLPSLVEAALRLSRTRPGNVWILSSELWTQVLSLPAESVSGLKQEEVTRALGFEAEPFSGINALEAAAAHVPLPGEGPAAGLLADRGIGSPTSADRGHCAAGGRAAFGNVPSCRPAAAAVPAARRARLVAAG